MADNNKTSTQAQGSEGKDNKVTAPSKPVEKSRSQCANEGFSSWPNFMHSYQLKRKDHRNRSDFRSSCY